MIGLAMKVRGMHWVMQVCSDGSVTGATQLPECFDTSSQQSNSIGCHPLVKGSSANEFETSINQASSI